MIIAMILIFTFGIIIGSGITAGYMNTSPNDWTEAWSDIGEWNVTYHWCVETTTKQAVYTIYYSKSRSIYKLKCTGYYPKSNSKYITACNKLNELNSKL